MRDEGGNAKCAEPKSTREHHADIMLLLCTIKGARGDHLETRRQGDKD